LGLKHPDELDDVLTDKQFAQWQCYYAEYPFGHWVDNFMRARICSSMLADPKAESSLMPKLEKNQLDMTEDELILSMPGGSGAMQYLDSLKNGNH